MTADIRCPAKPPVSVDDYRWGDTLKVEDRQRLLDETREALDADPGTSTTSADVPDDISDGQLYLMWLRA